VIDAFPTDQQEQVRVQLAGNLLAVLSQCLCPRVDTDGMVAGYEFMYVTPGIQNLIRENKSFRIDSEIQTGKRFGMQLLDDNLYNLFTEGKISAEETIDKSRNPGQMVDKMQKAGYDVEAKDDAMAAELEESGGGASTMTASGSAASANGKPGAGTSEAERQAQIAANRARMQAAKK
jgi:Tfp pilus assembly ATPase PilU